MKEKIDLLYPQLASRIRKTPLVKDQGISDLTGTEVFLKHEHQQLTGSFKIRGAFSKFLSLRQSQGSIPQVVAASTGNHAAAVCHAAQEFDCQPILFVPETITSTKLEKLKASQAEVRIAGEQSGETELLALAWAEEKGIPMIHPYNDPEVIAGQGTLGKELLDQNPELQRIFIPAGGGGLISGVGSYIKTLNPDIEIIGVQPANASELSESLKLGKPVPVSTRATISDGTAGGLDPQSITLDLCRKFVDRFILVTEQEIISSMKLLYRHAGIQAEPSAALATAGIIKVKSELAGDKCASIVCGGNILKKDFDEIIN